MAFFCPEQRISTKSSLDLKSDSGPIIPVQALPGKSACLNGAKEKGVIYGTGVYQPGEVNASPAMKEAYEMGKNV